MAVFFIYRTRKLNICTRTELVHEDNKKQSSNISADEIFITTSTTYEQVHNSGCYDIYTIKNYQNNRVPNVGNVYKVL